VKPLDEDISRSTLSILSFLGQEECGDTAVMLVTGGSTSDGLRVQLIYLVGLNQSLIGKTYPKDSH
jgi:hypothetical protein